MSDNSFTSKRWLQLTKTSYELHIAHLKDTIGDSGKSTNKDLEEMQDDLLTLEKYIQDIDLKLEMLKTDEE